jgi:hypothetical protein
MWKKPLTTENLVDARDERSRHDIMIPPERKCNEGPFHGEEEGEKILDLDLEW